MILKQPDRSKHSRKKAGLCAGFPRAINSDLDGLVVGGHKAGVRVDGDGHSKGLSAPASAHESQVAEFGHL